MKKSESPELLENGKWLYKGVEFSSEEAANTFKKNSDKEPSFFFRVWETTAGKWAITGLIFLASVSLIGFFQPSRPVAAAAPNSFDAADALAMCQSAIKIASKDAEKAVVPYVPNQNPGDGYFFAWNNTTKLARLRNGLGVEVGVTALCKVDAISKRITSLTLDGHQLI